MCHCCMKLLLIVMGYCVVFGCMTTSGCGTGFHFFPKCKTVRLPWIAAVRRHNFQPTKFLSLHFSPSAFTMELAKECGYTKLTLRPDVVPTENLPSSAWELKPTGVEKTGLAVAKRHNYEVNTIGAHQMFCLR